ncbi:MAG: PQQ-binding-like beta-propeller repeat protein [Armatimonadia bacterium]
MRRTTYQGRLPLVSVLCVCAAILLTACGCAENWPTYMRDLARSGVSEEALTWPLQEHWTFKSPVPPQNAWADPHHEPLEGMLERPRLRFDDAFHVAVADGLLYFGSSADNKLYCVEAATGRVRWTYFTGGPVRLAPMVDKGRVYFGSDDGCAYCLDAATGGLVWRCQGGPTDERVLGHGRMISLWPVRTSVVVDDGIAYFAAGIFPGERIYLHAVKASDGSRVWLNDTLSDRSSGRDGFSPQGYALASKTALFLAAGRNMPAAFSRTDGKWLYQSGGNWRSVGIVGGTYALLEGDKLYSGTEAQVAGIEQATGKVGFAWYPGKRLVVTPAVSYMLKDSGISALDRVKYPDLSRLRKGLETKRSNLSSASPRPKDYQAQLKQIDDDLVANQRGIDACTLFNFAREGLECMIVTKDGIIAGGAGSVIALDRAKGAKLWEASVDGTAKGLAVSDGKLFVSTDTGVVECFAVGPRPAQVAPAPATTAEPFPQDEMTRVCRYAAKKILDTTGITRGYCLVLGCGTGRLAYELARRSELNVYAVDPDPEKVAAARATLDRTGMYGSRITVDQGNLASLPYSGYFANLVVSEDALLRGKVDVPAAEVLRVLKPCGGMVYFGQPKVSSSAVARLDEQALRQWAAAPEFTGCRIDAADGVWMSYLRGALPGAGAWTHQYGTPGNTASSTDTAVECPLGVLWYGEPGPDKVPSRHSGNAAPLSINGRVYLQGIDRIMCFDAYNGLMNWEREIPGAYRVGMVRECSNLAADDRSLFVVTKDKCLRLDNLTGNTVATYAIPSEVQEGNNRWSYVAVVNGILYGSAASATLDSKALFAIDADSGETRWVYRGTKIRNNAIAVDGGRVFFPDDRATPEQREVALKTRIQEIMAREKVDSAAALKLLGNTDVRVVVALDAKSGATAWEKPVDLTDCGMHILSLIATKDVLVFCGAHSNGHYWPQFLSGEYASRRATVLAQKDGSLLWSKAIGYRIRPLAIGDMLVAEPWAFDLHTGEQKMRENPVTGRSSIWEFERPGHHCGTISGCPNALLFRSYCMGYYDLASERGTEHFAGQRPGCWINMIPANGLVVVPEASSGCLCLFSIHCTTVLAPRKQEKAWGMYSDRAPTTPVKHLSVNLGGPGDRTDDKGKLWLSFPRPSGRMQLALGMSVSGLAGGGYFSKSADTFQASGTDSPWVYSSGYAGLSKCNLTLVKPEDGAAVYTVRLGFVDTESTKRGQRVFDIKLQGKTVAQNFDLYATAGGPNRVVTKEFRGIEVSGDLALEFVPKTQGSPAQAPLLNCLEIERERVVQMGMVLPTATVSDLEPTASGVVTLGNSTDRDFDGVLRLTTSEGISVTPAQVPVKVARDQTVTVPVQIKVGSRGPKADKALNAELVWADGRQETKGSSRVEYLGNRGRITIKASGDAYVSAGSPSTNFGQAANLLVDGGNNVMEDESYNITYIKFPISIPGKPVSVTFRLRGAASEAAESNDSGRIYLVTEPWDENKITFANRPKPGKEIAVLGRVGRDVWESRKLNVDLTGLTELGIVIVPTTTDGASYVSKEGILAPELVVEYDAE